MKRKLALLLAAVMTLSAAPVNLFAATTNKLSRTGIPASNYTLFYEPGVTNGAGEVNNDSSNIEYYTNGSYLVIKADDSSALPDGASFDLILTNAEWAYYVHDTSKGGTDAEYDTKRNQSLGLKAGDLTDLNLTEYVFYPDKDDTGTSETYVSSNALYDALRATMIANYKADNATETVDSVNFTTDISIASGTTVTAATKTASEIEGGVVGSTPAWANGSAPTVDLVNLGDVVEDEVTATANVTIITTPATTGSETNAKIPDRATIGSSKEQLNKVYGNTIDLTKGKLSDVTSNRLVYTRYGRASTEYGDGKELKYTLTLNNNNKKKVSVTVNEKASKEDVILIPLAIINEDAGDIELRIDNISNNSGITKGGRFDVATVSGGYTKTTVSTVRRGYDTISPINILVSENRIGSLSEGSFRLTAPSGYEWSDPSRWTFTFESGLSDNKTFVPWSETNKPTVNTADGEYSVSAVYRSTSSSKNSNNQVDVTIHAMSRSTTRVGVLSINGTDNNPIQLIAEDNSSISASGTIKATIRNTGNNDIVTNETFDIATVAEYGLALRVVDSEIPELVSGRYDEDAWTTRVNGEYKPSADTGIVDDYHKAAKIEVRESVKESWWASSGTTFVLPEGARFLKVEFDELSQFAPESNIVTAESNNRQFANAHKREESFITINDNVLTLNNLTVKYGSATSSRAKIQMDVWVNLEADFEGDVDLSLTNYSVRSGSNEEQSVTIATAITPVVIETSVSDVKIGLQYVPVADFNITETKAGNLLQGKEVWITVSDEISTDMYLAPGFTNEVSEGNLKISNVNAKSTLTANGVGTSAGDAQLKFEIDRESTVASTISFTNVQVKIGKDVPYSNVSASEDRGINLVVWGPAIAENYDGLYNTNTAISTKSNDTTYMNSYDLFSTPGIRAKYINVISKDTTNNNFTNVVEVTIGNPVVLINGEEYTMPVAAYVSTASNSTMVPLRFVAYALGLDEGAVTWDAATSTATVDAGTRVVQFTSGSNYYVVNGVQVGMTSPDGLPVATEISEERAFIPFRMLGNAFDIPVSWDGTTSTAIYNDPSAL